VIHEREQRDNRTGEGNEISRESNETKVEEKKREKEVLERSYEYAFLHDECRFSLLIWFRSGKIRFTEQDSSERAFVACTKKTGGDQKILKPVKSALRQLLLLLSASSISFPAGTSQRVSEVVQKEKKHHYKCICQA
jgi:hypothetical protein